MRLPRSRSTFPRESALDYEIAHEQASALGRLGRALEAALAALSGFDRAQAEGQASATAPAHTVRKRLVQEASHALWCFIVQREACGLRDQRLIVREYGVPAEVKNRMGALGSSARSRSASERFTTS